MSWNLCPTCANRCRVLATRAFDNYVRRRYKCLGPVEHRWSTEETLWDRQDFAIQLTINDQTHSVYRWSELSGVPAPTIYRRIVRGIQGPTLLKKGRV